MKKNLLFLFLFFECFSLLAQDYLPGKLADANSKTSPIFYDRTQNYVSKNVFQSVYKIFDRNKREIYSVSLIHERLKSIIIVSVKPKGAALLTDTVTYVKSESGLILSDQGNLDTAFNILQPYIYLLSFADTSRDYPIVHKLLLHNKNTALLDPITKIRLKKNKQLVESIISKSPHLRNKNALKEWNDKGKFNAMLLRKRDSLYAKNKLLVQHIEKMRSEIEKDIDTLFKTKKVFTDAKRYEGEKKSGEPNGKGLFMSNGNYYDGYFKNGKFVSGNVIIHYDVYEYCGEYSNDSLNGLGRVKYKDESYHIGIFKKGQFYDGIVYSINKSGEVFFGNSKREQRTGYGELHNTKGELYYGEFLDGHLIKGYSKDIDPFGFFTYSRIENGIKTPVDIQQGEEFFNPLLSARQ